MCEARLGLSWLFCSNYQEHPRGCRGRGPWYSAGSLESGIKCGFQFCLLRPAVGLWVNCLCLGVCISSETGDTAAPWQGSCGTVDMKVAAKGGVEE